MTALVSDTASPEVLESGLAAAAAAAAALLLLLGCGAAGLLVRCLGRRGEEQRSRVEEEQFLELRPEERGERGREERGS